MHLSTVSYRSLIVNMPVLRHSIETMGWSLASKRNGIDIMQHTSQRRISAIHTATYME